ncbi:response regulator [Brevibacillus dissolubilis]|uniref:response regulator n=1 Tax=Brevibacillus dissolubilis TaxID=1844116 RepID=UPI001116B570|nr:response regulator [Brevibacillus dissolubilis]
MSMYKLMIAEDEPTIRHGLESMIPWEEYQFTLCPSASDGEEAFARLLEVQPDILLSDIRMPILDGIQLLEKIRAAGLSTEVIILTGFGDFEYAKQALKYRAFDYLLKPSPPQEILQAILSVRDALEAKKGKERKALQLEREWDKHMSSLKKQTLLQWIKQPQVKSNRATLINELGMYIKPDHIQVGVIEGMIAPASASAGESASADVIQRVNLLRQALEPFYWEQLEICIEGAELIWFGNPNSRFDGTEMGVGSSVRGVTPGHSCHPRQESGADFIMGSGSNSPMATLTKLLFTLSPTLSTSCFIGISSIKESIYGLAHAYLEAKEALQSATPTDCVRIYEQASLPSATTTHRTVQAALDVIHQGYNQNLTLESVARDVFVSTAYLSTLFKQEMGVNFLDYLHQYRIEKAKELLTLPHLKVYQVANQVGYQDERHFSTTFKKWTGQSPSQYMKRRVAELG